MADGPDMSELDAAVQRLQDTYAREPSSQPKPRLAPPPRSDGQTPVPRPSGQADR